MVFKMKYYAPAILTLAILLAGDANAADGSEASLGPSLSLADEFLAAGEAAAAALEYRRLEADTDPADVELRGALLLAAADAYRADGAWDRMGRVLDRIESEAGLRGPIDPEVVLLRLCRSEGTKEWASAAEWGETLAEMARTPEEGAAASRIAAANWLRAGSPAYARMATDDPDALAAIARWEAGKDKSPRIGGLLGIIPGMGYAYSGEYGNMMRSIFLNGIFVWAMVETAEEDQWALFSVASFFELTWFTGSIYGGIDAAHRANDERLNAAASDILPKDAPFAHPRSRLDLFRVRTEF